MKYIPDRTGRFGQRPFYESGELDAECETIITTFMQERCGRTTYPIPTDILTKLLERDADDLDLYADLSGEGPNVEAVTEFYPGHKPRVRVARELIEQEQREHRLRTTLSHEYGHVKFHSYLWEVEAQTEGLFPEPKPQIIQKCRRSTILDAPMADWMEWQAGYVCGALLMPKNAITRIVSAYFEQNGAYGPVKVNSQAAFAIQKVVAGSFAVSQEAARVRLLKLGSLSHNEISKPLF